MVTGHTDEGRDWLVVLISRILLQSASEISQAGFIQKTAPCCSSGDKSHDYHLESPLRSVERGLLG